MNTPYDRPARAIRDPEALSCALWASSLWGVSGCVLCEQVGAVAECHEDCRDEAAPGECGGVRVEVDAAAGEHHQIPPDVPRDNWYQ